MKGYDEVEERSESHFSLWLRRLYMFHFLVLNHQKHREETMNRPERRASIKEIMTLYGHSKYNTAISVGFGGSTFKVN